MKAKPKIKPATGARAPRKTVTPRLGAARGSEESSTASGGSALWAVMKAYAFDSLEVAAGWPLRAPDEGPHRFIPVFSTRGAAVKWEGCGENVAMLMPTTEPGSLGMRR